MKLSLKTENYVSMIRFHFLLWLAAYLIQRCWLYLDSEKDSTSSCCSVRQKIALLPANFLKNGLGYHIGGYYPLIPHRTGSQRLTADHWII